MNKAITILSAIIISIIITSCEQEIGRLDLTKNNPAEIQFRLKKGEEVKLWTDIDITYKEKPLFVYDCEFYKGDEFLFKGGTDPLATTNNRDEVLINENNITRWKFYGQLEGTFKAKEDATYRIKTTFIKNSNPDLDINKVEMVFIK